MYVRIVCCMTYNYFIYLLLYACRTDFVTIKISFKMNFTLCVIYQGLPYDFVRKNYRAAAARVRIKAVHKGKLEKVPVNSFIRKKDFVLI